ncbi:MAG: hypothetical protein ABI605_08380 [Rhizobacter sp.]
MRVLSHRGLWEHPAEKNAAVAFQRSFERGFGTETDIRDAGGRLVVSHDVPRGGEPTLQALLHWHREAPEAARLPLALNIKADGLAPDVAQAMAGHTGEWFAFDMAVPDMRAWLALGLPVYTRMSEVEREPCWLERCAGVWLDAFEGVWYDTAEVERCLSSRRAVCVVSEDLHRREVQAQWRLLKPFAGHPSLSICTDRPDEARAFFGGRP